MNILLTGSEGFIGKHLYNSLRDLYNVIGFDKKVGQDILYAVLPSQIDLVIHLAGSSGVRHSLNNPREYWENNVEASRIIFNKYKNKRILYASSSTAEEPEKNPYAATKFLMERMAPEGSIGMRFTTVYGPNAREDMLIPMIEKGTVPYINVDHSRDFIHVYDLVSAIKKVMKSNISGTIDIGTGFSTNLNDLMTSLNMNPLKKIGKHYERLDNVADINILKQLGWSPKYKLFDYLRKQND
tara:strand:+ start:1200 stop:1922 length:723 start_codon:yes stop_codon:yes gene_type:complete